MAAFLRHKEAEAQDKETRGKIGLKASQLEDNIDEEQLFLDFIQDDK